MRQMLIAECIRFFITKCISFSTKCNSYYKMRQYNVSQIVHIHYIDRIKTWRNETFTKTLLEKKYAVKWHFMKSSLEKLQRNSKETLLIIKKANLRKRYSRLCIFHIVHFPHFWKMKAKSTSLFNIKFLTPSNFCVLVQFCIK